MTRWSKPSELAGTRGEQRYVLDRRLPSSGDLVTDEIEQVSNLEGRKRVRHPRISRVAPIK